MERQRRVGRKMIWMKWILLPAVCQHTICISQPYRLVDEKTTCLEFKVESRLSCSRSDQFYHCLLDENYTKEFEVCRDWKWIPGGKCAYFNSYGIGNIDERDCIPSSTLQCAIDQYRSDLNTRYSACYVKKRIAITTPINTPTIKSTGSGASDVQSTTETAPTESTPTESQFNDSAMGIAFGVIVPPILLLIVAGIILFKKRRHTQGTSQREIAVERGEGDALMNTETKCLAENEQNQQLIEKDEGTSTEDKESLPLLAENKNENQSEGQLEENSMKNKRISVSQNYDSPQKNESFKTPPTTPAVQTEPDTDIGRTEIKDDKKNEKKEGEGFRGGYDSPKEVSPGVGAEKKKKEGPIEKGHSPDIVSPDNGKEDDSHLSPVNDKNGDNGKQNTDVTEEDQSEEKGNKDQDVKQHVTDKPSNQTVKTDLNDENNETTQNSDDQNDEGGETSDNTAMKHVNEQENEHQNNLNSSADSGSEQDESVEDTSPKKDAVGIFVDSLESIKKEDDEEGGRSELQDLLEYMCTGPVRKILFNVVKMYVDNPDSYFKDESKKALLKSALPPEFHSAHDLESEYRHSIPVMYAILQVSLSEKQPKSGWGQKVKDTDTGVGDDVERVYQAHTLSREIWNPEEISVDGYVRLFEMFIGAVERLDIKGKCSEDYREIVRRWETIQRKLWVKDKLTTFTNFIKKWS